jgi:HprK-related kinase A
LIVADLPIGELRRQLDHAGLRMRIGPVVAEIRSPFRAVEQAIALHYAAHELAPDEFADFRVSVEPPAGLRRWFKPQAVFRFDGSLPFKPLAADQAFPLLEWGLNWCVCAHCQQYLIVHGAVVERDGRAMILPAPPGSGKSTLCAALVARGWRLLSDELTLIDPDTGRLVPMPRPISLKNESIATIAAFWSGAAMSAVVHDTAKGSVVHVQPPATSVRQAGATAAPAWIVLPQFRAGASAALTPLSRAAAFMRLVDNAFNYSLLGRRGFELLADVATACDCYEFTYGGALDDAVRAFDGIAGA